jgi:hypothetical protein
MARIFTPLQICPDNVFFKLWRDISLFLSFV